ncbi:DMT family transporter [Paracoccus luteus]|uniref:aromatic amino acid exporter YddG n=1 Tax=Paracoccus luteus TaxID=2508543 RepID=UPI00106F51E7|nr:EamA family transporter [Paracoccus luteus]
MTTTTTTTHDPRRATLTGCGAVALWSLLALTTVLTAPVPPFLLSALGFAVGGGLLLAVAAWRGRLGVLRAVPFRSYAFGTLGLFGYHALYFTALRLAPPAQAGLIAYLWPLLIVLLSGLLPGERLSGRHVAGAVMAFAGAAAIVLARGGGADAAPAPLTGYALAASCALVWAVYSLGSRRMAGVPTEAVAVNCLATAALSAALHPLVEPTLWPVGAAGWLAVLALGLGPVGAAFALWDVGVKRGNIQLLGTAAYAAPVLSTLALIAAGLASGGAALILAAVLIAGGALVAASGGRG